MRMRPGPQDDAMRARFARHLQKERKRLEGWQPLLVPAFPGNAEDGRLGSDDGGYSSRLSAEENAGVVRLRVGDIDDQLVQDMLDDVLDEQTSRSSEDDADTTPVEEQATILVAGQPLQTTLARLGNVWTAVIAVPAGATGMSSDQGQVRAALAGWNVEPGSVTLKPVTDVTPWVRDIETMFAGGGDEPPLRPVPEGSPVGREAVRALIEQAAKANASSQRIMRDRGARRRERGDERVDLWSAATEAVQTATGLDEYDAADRLAQVVNQLANVFHDEADVFTLAVRQRAIEESVDFLLTGTAPTIAAVQEKAETAWALNAQLSELMRKRVAADEDVRQAWLEWATAAAT